MENVRKHRNVKLVTAERKINYLVSELNYCSTKFFTENLLAKEMRKTQTIMNKSAYLDLPILDHSKTVMYEFWYDHEKTKYVIWIQTVYVKTGNIYKDIEEDIETRFDTSNFEIDRPLPKGKIEKVIQLMKDGLGGKIIK